MEFFCIHRMLITLFPSIHREKVKYIHLLSELCYDEKKRTPEHTELCSVNFCNINVYLEDNRSCCKLCSLCACAAASHSPSSSNLFASDCMPAQPIVTIFLQQIRIPLSTQKYLIRFGKYIRFLALRIGIVKFAYYQHLCVRFWIILCMRVRLSECASES